MPRVASESELRVTYLVHPKADFDSDFNGINIVFSFEVEIYSVVSVFKLATRREATHYFSQRFSLQEVSNQVCVRCVI